MSMVAIVVRYVVAVLGARSRAEEVPGVERGVDFLSLSCWFLMRDVGLIEFKVKGFWCNNHSIV